MNKASRTETEMRILLNDFLTVWKKYPYLRFGQLVVCLLGNDPFYVEDNKTREKINKAIWEGIGCKAQ